MNDELRKRLIYSLTDDYSMSECNAIVDTIIAAIQETHVIVPEEDYVRMRDCDEGWVTSPFERDV